MKKEAVSGYTNMRNATFYSRAITDKKYLVLKMGSDFIAGAGLGTYVLNALCGISFAIENQYIPVIDWKNCHVRQYDASKSGRENVWEYFFEQPFNVTVEQAYESENYYVIDDVSTFPFGNSTWLWGRYDDFDDNEVMILRSYYQKYIRLNKKVKEYFKQYRSQQNLDSGNIVGVVCRGTDYKDKPVWHTSYISIDKIFRHIDELYTIMDVDKIFLATEDKEILESFEKRYPGKVIFPNAKRYYDLGHNLLADIQQGEDGYDRDLKYLYSIYIVSECPACIVTPCSGAAWVALMRENRGLYYKFVFDGINRPKGIVVGSDIERKEGKVVRMGGKPILFYALNNCKLLGVQEVDIILSNKLKIEYEQIVGSGKEFGMKFHFVISDTYNVAEYMAKNPDFMTASRVLVLYSDYFAHGNKVSNEVYLKSTCIDGAYVWGGINRQFQTNIESIAIDKKTGMPDKAYASYKLGNYSLMGKYLFDYDLKDIVEKIYTKKRDISIVDILNEYIKRKKLFFVEYQRGTIFVLIKDKGVIDKTGEVIELLEELQGNKIGDFEVFRQKRIE